MFLYDIKILLIIYLMNLPHINFLVKFVLNHNKDYINQYLNIDKNVYINYGQKTMNDFLQEYEINHMKDDDISLWECGHKRPDLKPAIYHPNQHGYKLYIDYLFKEILPKQYNFK
jgi:SAM-dependent MidA family methyltransferase